MKPLTRSPAKLSARHYAIIDYLVAYPDAPLAQVGSRFNLSPVRIRQLVSSDIFQQRILERQDIVFERTLSLREKLEAAAHLAVDKVTESLEISDSPEYHLAATDKLLSKLGYGGKMPTVTINSAGAATTINVGVDSDMLQQARDRIAAASVIEATPHE